MSSDEIIQPPAPAVATAPAQPAIPPPEAPAPPPSRAVAIWLVLTFMNVTLLVLLIPASIFDDKKISFVVNLISAVVTGGFFAAGFIWFKDFFLALPQRRGFKVINIVGLCVLIPFHVSQQNVVAIHPQIDPATPKFKLVVDKDERTYEPGGNVRLSIKSHSITMAPENESTEAESKEQQPVKSRSFSVNYKDVVNAIFSDYRPTWGLLYSVGIITEDANVEVQVKRNGDFDPEFLKKPPRTELSDKSSTSFTPKAGSRNEFVYRGANDPLGCNDHVYLPEGEYVFVASQPGCSKELDKSTLKIPGPQSRSLLFKRLCDNGQ